MPRLRSRTLLFLLVFVFITALLSVARWHRIILMPLAIEDAIEDALPASFKHTIVGSMPESAFEWNSTKAPSWLARPAKTDHPLRMRVAVISHAAEFERRSAVRELVLKGVPRNEVNLDYLFFLGHVTDKSVSDGVAREAATYGDIKLLDLPDNKTTLGTKRWLALQWAGEADPSSYEWFFSMDTDAFVRFAALARRAASWHPLLLRPHTESVMWGNMLTMNRHWRESNHVPAEDRISYPGDNERWYSGDESWLAEWYDYPWGFGFLISTHLVARLTAPGIKLPHNVTYPLDDMMIGSWVQENAPDATLLRDLDGFHDPPEHGWKTSPISWASVVVHHVNVDQMRGLRSLRKFRNEWERR